LNAGVKLLLVLASLAAGQSVAARAESTGPRAAVVRMIGAPEQRAEERQAVFAEPLTRVAQAPHPAVQRTDARASDAPLYLLNRALLR
jgi:hypothetical protein